MDTLSQRSFKSDRKLNIALVSDFFFPNTGGVEMHILNLAYCLIERGHKVIGITHNYGDRIGVRYMQNGLKIYYCPFTQIPGGAGGIIFPVLHWPHLIPLLRNILLREEIEVCHWHQSSSQIGVYMSLYADMLGIRMVRTNHSLFELDNPFILQLNTLHAALIEINNLDHVISVSHAVRENEIIRANVPVARTSVIPNAIDPNQFTADPSLRNPVGTINIVFVARLTHRKGNERLADCRCGSAD
jgi:phosphatidylinositol glycan class A protein